MTRGEGAGLTSGLLFTAGILLFLGLLRLLKLLQKVVRVSVLGLGLHLCLLELELLGVARAEVGLEVEVDRLLGLHGAAAHGGLLDVGGKGVEGLLVGGEHSHGEGGAFAVSEGLFLHVVAAEDVGGEDLLEGGFHDFVGD